MASSSSRIATVDSFARFAREMSVIESLCLPRTPLRMQLLVCYSAVLEKERGMSIAGCSRMSTPAKDVEHRALHSGTQQQRCSGSCCLLRNERHVCFHECRGGRGSGSGMTSQPSCAAMRGTAAPVQKSPSGDALSGTCMQSGSDDVRRHPQPHTRQIGRMHGSRITQ